APTLPVALPPPPFRRRAVLRGAGPGIPLPAITNAAVMLQSGEMLQPQTAVIVECERKHAVPDRDPLRRDETAGIGVPLAHAAAVVDPQGTPAVERQHLDLA